MRQYMVTLDDEIGARLEAIAAGFHGELEEDGEPITPSMLLQFVATSVIEQLAGEIEDEGWNEFVLICRGPSPDHGGRSV